MTPQQRKLLIPLIVVGASLGIALLYMANPDRTSRDRVQQLKQEAAQEAANENAAINEDTEQQETASESAEETTDTRSATPPNIDTPPITDTPILEQPQDDGSGLSLNGLHAVAPREPAVLRPLGSFDWRQHDFNIEFSTFGAGIDRIVLTDIWNTSKAKRTAEDVKARLKAGDINLAQALSELSGDYVKARLDAGDMTPEEAIAALPKHLKARLEAQEITLAEALDELPAEQRYVIQQTRSYRNNAGGDWYFPAFVARSIWIEGGANNLDQPTAWINVFGDVWSQGPDDPGLFTTEIRNDQDEIVLRITRRFRFGDGSFDLIVDQKFENLTSAPLNFRWKQYGQANLDADRAKYMDRRRFRVGHLGDASRGADQSIVRADSDLFWERGAGGVPAFLGGSMSFKDIAAENDHAVTEDLWNPVWPNETSLENNYTLSWFAADNRYFAVAIHPLQSESTGVITLDDVIETITPFYDGKVGDDRDAGHDNIALMLDSPAHSIPARGPDGPGTESLDYGVYAGPLDRYILGDEEPFATLNMDFLILYQMSSCCAIFTFQWLAEGLLWFLSLVHAGVRDWGVAIIALVVVVRLALHPITKRSQIAMQRFQKAMQKLSPDLEKLKQKYKDDPKRLQQEQLRLWKEHNVSPASMLGCLPMFLQMPIWVALYAMLYFAWDLRHEPAFWGIFQLFGDWQFLADLSAGDHCFWEFENPMQFLMWNVTGINALPFLMAGVFYVQQKYMTPQTTATMSKEQQQTQKMMRVMMVVLFPLMLYSAPSGLTLYILTSSIWGIIESRHIRKHVETLDLESTIKRKPKSKKKAKPKDAQGRAYRDALERAKQKRQKKKDQQYKKRK